MSEFVVVGLVAFALAAWIALPLLTRGTPDAVGPQLTPGTGATVEEKHSIYRSILDLELDHSLGKLDQDEYLRMRSESEAEALAVIAATSLEGESVDDILEQEIREARERLRRNK
ncbi:MAG TPA: hypothetical protein VHJ40_07435 [Actinomycetota bacterium]|jgi:hypothetical protein|nr:hypothetical protein [Actinomycetota bacterium]